MDNSSPCGNAKYVSRKNYFTTGEFARLCNVKKQTLFHYDDIGILSPEYKADNGYRYYHYTQLEVFGVISMLKEMGMPLRDIKNYLDHRSPQALIQLLKLQKEDITEKINELTQQLSYLESKIAMTGYGLTARSNLVIFEERPKEYYITTSYGGSSDEKTVTSAYTKHMNFCRQLGIKGAYSIGGMIRTDDLPQDRYYGYAYLYTKIDDPSMYDKCFIKPAGKYAVLYHDRGGYDTVADSFSALINYIADKGLKADEFIYEDMIFSEFAVKGYENYTLKLSVRVL